MLKPQEPPQLSAAEVERLRRWHETAYQSARQRTGPQRVAHLGLDLSVPPDVMPIVDVSHGLGAAVLAEAQHSQVRTALDMGTGCGVNALLAARSCESVVAVDTNPHAVTAAGDNAVRNGLAHRVRVRSSDVFAHVPERFDLIVFDPPFRWFAPRDVLETATTDENYRALAEFFRQARDHLTDVGRMLLFFGTTGDLEYFRWLAGVNGFSCVPVVRQQLMKENRVVEYVTFRLWPQ